MYRALFVTFFCPNLLLVYGESILYCKLRIAQKKAYLYLDTECLPILQPPQFHAVFHDSIAHVCVMSALLPICYNAGVLPFLASDPFVVYTLSRKTATFDSCSVCC